MNITQRLRALVTSVHHCGDTAAYKDAAHLEEDVSKVLDGWNAIESSRRKLHQELASVQQWMSAGKVDYSQWAVLYVDDEVRSLRCFARAYGRTFRILTANSAVEALKVLREPKGQVGVMLANYKMPGKNGRWLLNHAQQIDPSLIRILVSTFPSADDLAAASAAANSGAIHSYIVEPWDPLQLEHQLKRALELFVLRNAISSAVTALAHPAL